MSIFVGTNWKIELMPEWIGEDDEECATIYHPDGVGALQISSYTKEDEVTQDDLKEFASEHIEAGAKIVEAKTGAFEGFTFAFGIDNEFWQYWYVSSGKTALLITYNCDDSDQEYEIAKIKTMIASLSAT